MTHNGCHHYASFQPFVCLLTIWVSTVKLTNVTSLYVRKLVATDLRASCSDGECSWLSSKLKNIKNRQVLNEI